MDISPPLRLSARRGRPGSQPFNRRLLALAALLAFFLQSLAVQTHVHPAAPTLKLGVTAAVNTPSPGPLTGQDFGPGSCRLCQEMAHAGTYIVPIAILPLVVLGLVQEPFRPELATRLRPAPAFAWHSRGPPTPPSA
jgi:hypothetical protein